MCDSVSRPQTGARAQRTLLPFHDLMGQDGLAGCSIPQQSLEGNGIIIYRLREAGHSSDEHNSAFWTP